MTGPASSLERVGVEVGELLADKYRVERVLGHGGMGVVVAARHEQLGFRVALKFMLPGTADDEGQKERFLREARAVGALRSEHVARVMDFGVLATGAAYIVMEYLEGSDLLEVLEVRTRLPPEEAVDYVLQACEAMVEAHEQSIVHRDLKPQNLFLTHRPDGTPLVKVLDFGISKRIGGDAHSLDMTASAMMIGSPLYMSPEQMRSSKDVDARTDIYSLGAVLYQLIDGRPPIEAETIGELAERLFTGKVEPLRTRVPSVSMALEAVILRSLEKKPEDRFASVAELVRALASTRSEKPAKSMAAPAAPLSERIPAAASPTPWPAPAVAATTSDALTRAPSTAPVARGRLQTLGVAGAVVACLVVLFEWLRPATPRTIVVPEVAVVSAALSAAPPLSAATASSPPIQSGSAEAGSAEAGSARPASKHPLAVPSVKERPAGPGGYDPFAN